MRYVADYTLTIFTLFWGEMGVRNIEKLAEHGTYKVLSNDKTT